MRGLKGKNAIVTGGGGGIGREICRRLASEGCASIGIFDLNGKDAQETANVLEGTKVSVHIVDVGDYDAVKREVDAFKNGNGSIDILVNNAGWDRAVLFVDSDPAFWRKIIDINLMGPMNVTHAVVKHMIPSGGGKVVNIASDAGRVGSSGEAAYAACKGGLIALTKSLARELARYNIIFNSVCPGPTNTPLLAAFAAESNLGAKFHEAMKKATPLRRIGEPTDCPGLVAFLASDDANFILGQTISVSGGLTMNG